MAIVVIDMAAMAMAIRTVIEATATGELILPTAGTGISIIPARASTSIRATAGGTIGRGTIAAIGSHGASAAGMAAGIAGIAMTIKGERRRA
jgi:hypothetical protein